MRVGILAPPWAPVPPALYGGIETVLDQLARALVALGHEVVLFASGDSTCPVQRRAALAEAEGARIGMTVPELRHVLHAYEALEDVDVIHDHTVAGPFVAALVGAGAAHGPIEIEAIRLRRVPPVVTTIHGPFNEELADLYGRLASRVPVLAVSHHQAARAPQVPVAQVIHHGIDATAFPLGTGEGDDEGPYLLFLGRMSADKGPDRAIEVARKAGMRLLIAGKMREPWERAYFEERVEPALGADVRYLGEVPHERKLELLGGARALLFPIRWDEPFGLVMLEAFACGTPVVAFPEGAAPEVVEDGVTGFLCSDEEAMVDAVGRLDEIDRAACRAAVEGYFSAERMAREHAAFYASLLETSA
jgi:glycosyltransferase involved in cell wall biosynthesis